MNEQETTSLIPAIIPTSHNAVSALVEFYAQLLKGMAEERAQRLAEHRASIQQLQTTRDDLMERIREQTRYANGFISEMHQLKLKSESEKTAYEKRISDLLQIVSMEENKLATLQSQHNEGAFWKNKYDEAVRLNTEMVVKFSQSQETAKPKPKAKAK